MPAKIESSSGAVIELAEQADLDALDEEVSQSVIALAEVDNGMQARLESQQQRMDAMQEQIDALRSGQPAPVPEPPSDAVESTLEFADLQDKVRVAAAQGLMVRVRGKATWRNGHNLEVPPGCRGIFSDEPVGNRPELADRADNRGISSGHNQFGLPIIKWLGDVCTMYGFSTVGSYEQNADSRAFFWYAKDRCRLGTWDMFHELHPGGVWQLRGQDVPALIRGQVARRIRNKERRTGKVQMGYLVALYGRGLETFNQPLGQVPLTLVADCDLEQVRHTLAINHGGVGAMARCFVRNTENLNAAHIDAHERGSWDAPSAYSGAFDNDIACEWYAARLRGGRCDVSGNKFDAEKDNRILVTTAGEPNSRYWPQVYAWDNAPHNKFDFEGGAVARGYSPPDWPLYPDAVAV